MAASAGTVTLNLDANSVKLMRELQKAQRQTKSSASSMSTDFQQAFTRIAKASTVAVTAVAGALTMIYKSQKDVIDELGKSADAMGMQIERLQALRYAGDLAGVGAEGLTTNLERMQKRLGEIARNGGPAEKALKDIGLNIRTLINLSPDQQLEKISMAMASVENATIRASIANDLFGRDGARMIALMKELSNGGLDPVVASLDRMGASLSRLDAARLERANDAMTTARQVFTGVFQRLSVNMSDFVYYFGTAFTDMAVNSDMLGDHIDEMFYRVIRGAINVYESVGNAVTPIYSIVKSIWDGYRSLPGWAQELGVVGAVLFGKKGAAVVLGAAVAVSAIQSAISYSANHVSQRGSNFDGSQLDRLNQWMQSSNDWSVVGASAGFLDPEFENSVSTQASWLRGMVDQVIADRDRMKKEFNPQTTPMPMTIIPEDAPKNSMINRPLKEIRELDRFAEQAARNMQTHFADFLFNPFEKGVKGMAEGFINSFRRMAAEAASSKVLGMIIGAFANSANPMMAGLGAAFGGQAFVGPMPSRDSGGRGVPGQPYMIGRGAQPEIFIPDSAGTFIPNADQFGGGQTINISIDARDEGAESRIRSMIQGEMVPQILAAARGSTIAALRRPRFA